MTVIVFLLCVSRGAFGGLDAQGQGWHQAVLGMQLQKEEQKSKENYYTRSLDSM